MSVCGNVGVRVPYQIRNLKSKSGESHTHNGSHQRQNYASHSAMSFIFCEYVASSRENTLCSSRIMTCILIILCSYSSGCRVYVYVCPVKPGSGLRVFDCLTTSRLHDYHDCPSSIRKAFECQRKVTVSLSCMSHGRIIGKSGVSGTLSCPHLAQYIRLHHTSPPFPTCVLFL